MARANRSLVAPSLVKNNLAFGVQISKEFPELVSYLGLSFDDPELYTQRPSPRYWLLWPGVLMMLMYSFADVTLSMAPMVASKSQLLHNVAHPEADAK
jgi:hypothetical protein